MSFARFFRLFLMIGLLTLSSSSSSSLLADDEDEWRFLDFFVSVFLRCFLALTEPSSLDAEDALLPPSSEKLLSSSSSSMLVCFFGMLSVASNCSVLYLWVVPFFLFFIFYNLKFRGKMFS